LVCVVEELSGLRIEIALREQEIRDVKPGQPVQLKARALPFDTFEATVDQIAPSARAGDVQSNVVVYTQLDRPHVKLQPGMTGYARVECGQQPIAKIVLDRALGYIRTEFWWW